MGDVLVYMDPGINDRLLSFARPLADAAGGALVALVAGGEPVDVARLAAADVVLEVTHPALSPYLPEAHQVTLAAAVRARAPDVVVLESTTSGYDLAAATAATAGLPLVGYCVAVSLDGREAEAVSGIYGGQLEATVRTSLPAVFAISSGALRDAPPQPGRGEHVELAPPAELESLRMTFVDAVQAPDEGVDLTKGVMISDLAEMFGISQSAALANLARLGAELAASRPVIDSGWLPKVRQVGKSGATVKPKLYMALGVSGAPEHIEGMQGAELIVAINTDPGAAIFNVAHYGVVADLFDVAEELTSLLAG